MEIEKALPAFVWVKIESSTVKVDGDLEVLWVPKAAGGLLGPLDGGIYGLETGIGDLMPQIGEDVRQVAAEELGDHSHGVEPTVGRPPVPALEKLVAGPGPP